MNRRRLAIYLNDHMAASTGAVELVRRVAGANRGSGYEPTLAALQTEIEEDHAALVSIMDRLGVRVDAVRKNIAWAAEKLGRLKLNGQLTGYSPLSRLEELEILELAVTGKLQVWDALRRNQAVDQAELDGLINRARSQRERLEDLRLQAAAEALDLT